MIELVVHGSHSLKDKRRVVKSMKDRIRNRFNVSVAEVDHLDSRQRAGLGMAACGNSKPYVEGLLSKIVDMVRTHPEAHVTDYAIEVFGV